MENILQNRFGIIYKSTNIQDNKCYIGQTIQDFKKYKTNHISAAIRNNDKNSKHFYSAIRKYGKENFIWEIIDENIPYLELDDKEQEWVWLYKSNDNQYGYNLTSGGKNKRCLNKEIIAKMSLKQSGENSHTYRKDLDEKIDEILKLRHQGMSYKNIAKLYNCGPYAIKIRTQKYLNENLDKYRYDLDKNINEIIQLRKQGIFYRDIAIKFNCSVCALQTKLKPFLIDINLEIKRLQEQKIKQKNYEKQIKKKLNLEIAKQKISAANKGPNHGLYRHDLDIHINKMVELRKSGMYLNDIGKIFNCSGKAVKTRLVKQGLN